MAGSTNRRDFIKAGAVAAGLPVLTGGAAARARGSFQSRIEQIGAAPVLNRSLLTEPVKIASVELLKAGDQFLVRVRSQSGATGIAAAIRMSSRPPGRFWFAGSRRSSPARTRAISKRSWTASISPTRTTSGRDCHSGCRWPASSSPSLDLLGKVAGKPIGDLFGGVRRRDIAVYRASGNRGNSPEAGDRVPPETRRRDRRQGDQVPARRPHAGRRRVDAAGPRADSAHAQDVRRRHDDLRRRQRLIRRADRRCGSAG